MKYSIKKPQPYIYVVRNMNKEIYQKIYIKKNLVKLKLNRIIKSKNNKHV